MANRGVVYKGPGRVAVEAIPEPKFETPAGRKITHGVILKVFSMGVRRAALSPKSGISIAMATNV
jgi:glutathione-independent formaldehyde dehydrogenase